MGDADGSVNSIERAIGTYLSGSETKSIVTPGELVEWSLHVKAGQVVVAEARSEAFDPGLQIQDENKKIVARNDDRYPGDQRPLLLWRCPADGTYSLQVVSFNNKAGGQVFMRTRTYDTVDLLADGWITKDLNTQQPFLVRIPMKAGQIKEVFADFNGDFLQFRHRQVIGPTGLPDINLSRSIREAVSPLIAPVDGDYYVMEEPFGRNPGNAKAKITTREIVPAKLSKEGSVSAPAPTDRPAIWELSVKAGDLLEASAPDLHLDSRFVLAVQPDVSKFDLSKHESNPFVPQPSARTGENDGVFEMLPGRARDGRVAVFYVHKDAKLWIATNGAGPDGKQYSVRVKPAAAEFVASQPNNGRLRIGNTDYWAFVANAGDVMSLSSTAGSFTQHLVIRDPEMNEIRQTTAGPDQTSDSWRMIVQKPGRYLVAMSCLGNGGGGDYSFSRRVFSAKEFSRATPAKGEIAEGDVQIWKFTATPNDPLLIRWNSTNWDYDVSIYNEKGQEAGFQREQIDKNNTLGILKVDKPQTFLIVLTGAWAKSAYSIELNGIPTTNGRG